MDLNELLGLDHLVKSDGSAIQVTGISQNSRSIKSGYLFLACAGSRGSHGIAYGGEAAKNGARVIAWEPTPEVAEMPCHFSMPKDGNETVNIPLIAIENLHEKVGEFAARFYARPSEKMTVTGVTGTNGKTSIVFFIAQCLSINDKCGVMGTIGNGVFDSGRKNIKESTHTTADAVSIQSMMAEMLGQNTAQVVMEVSSHALDQSRVKGVDFDYAVFSNLSRDHLDYHGDMESYALAKRKLFIDQELKTAIVNQDDDEGKRVIAALRAMQRKVIAYSRHNTEDALVFAQDVKALPDGSEFELNVAKLKANIKIALLGDFNVSNVLATVGVLYAMGLDFEEIVSRIQQLKSVPGRMELLKSEHADRKALVVVDYAHTPDALLQALQSLQKHVKVKSGAKIWCVFGCGGNRDKGKRAQMGEIAASNADKIILTNDNPRDEQPLDIIRDIQNGIAQGVEYHIEADRRSAIKLAIQEAGIDDVVLVAGKGHETYQEVKGKRHYFSDQQAIEEIFKELEQ